MSTRARSPPDNYENIQTITTENINKMKGTTMQILYINNDGSGYADYINIAENTNIEQFFVLKMQGQHEEDFLIRVNRQPVARDYILREGDRISITPRKIEGARC